ncbi:hypothetical protein HaLaN_22075 [Haematococcus lacustris]|uniref:Uncharacterized protein n=1 Tax=Haematococcus lacustris TaxID=44745 RepID=A0A699ZNA4_HAELA|nr:hypothetical protein HaLaN_22075 [Haematococcus lacustris]
MHDQQCKDNNMCGVCLVACKLISRHDSGMVCGGLGSSMQIIACNLRLFNHAIACVAAYGHHIGCVRQFPRCSVDVIPRGSIWLDLVRITARPALAK